jgi:hypothetical protein
MRNSWIKNNNSNKMPLANIFGDLIGEVQKSFNACRGTKLARNGGMAP